MSSLICSSIDISPLRFKRVLLRPFRILDYEVLQLAMPNSDQTPRSQKVIVTGNGVGSKKTRVQSKHAHANAERIAGDFQPRLFVARPRGGRARARALYRRFLRGACAPPEQQSPAPLAEARRLGLCLRPNPRRRMRPRYAPECMGSVNAGVYTRAVMRGCPMRPWLLSKSTRVPGPPAAYRTAVVFAFLLIPTPTKCTD